MNEPEFNLTPEQHDAEGTRYYSERNYDAAALHYGKALIAGHYKRNPNEQSMRNLLWMYENNQIDQASDVCHFIREQQSEYNQLREKTHKNGALIFLGVFFGYMLLVYAGGIEGFFKNFSLIIGGGLAYGAWKLATATLDE
ncbi:hypothetical protein [Aquabacterium sp.]|uniref:hypothetical protein n=1 Tax=Aquabacterium sp. TaxID=1872578 RepID=UPI0025C4C478|nr:hypothetical protein [Aquabacterium sp.]